jgi:HEAT repeat protein
MPEHVGQRDKGNAEYLRHVVGHLRQLGQQPPSPEARREVEQHLVSQWQGVQSVAAQVLAGWGGRASVEALRGLLLRSYGQPHWWMIRGVAASALGRCVDASDADWVLDHYFGLRGVLAKHEMRPLVWSLPISAARARLEAECRSDERDNREAAMKAITFMPFPDKRELLRRLADDSDPAIRSAVRIWLDHLARGRWR